MSDLTVIFLTVNKLPEKWVKYHREVLLEATKGHKIITVSAKPMPEMPGENLIQEEPFTPSNIYEQMLRAGQVADTEYIAIAEDDVLYPENHFNKHRPPSNTFAYNMSKWGLFTWGEPTYHFKDRISNYSMIAPRVLMIDALQERHNRFPNGIPNKPGMIGELGKARVEKNLKVHPRRSSQFWTTVPLIHFYHTQSIDDRENRMVKRMGLLRAFDIPHWGKASELVKHFI